MDHHEIARRKAERKQERLFRELENALAAGQAVRFVGVTGIGYPHSFYRLHWRVGKKAWCAAEKSVVVHSPILSMNWHRRTVDKGDPAHVTFVDGDAAAVCKYEWDRSKPALTRAMETIRRYIYPAAP